MFGREEELRRKLEDALHRAEFLRMGVYSCEEENESQKARLALEDALHQAEFHRGGLSWWT